jgi:hypothetical protein
MKPPPQPVDVISIVSSVKLVKPVKLGIAVVLPNDSFEFLALREQSDILA